MDFATQLTTALQNAARGAAAAASTAGHDLTADIENFVIPHLQDIAAQTAAIAIKRQNNIYTDITAKDLLGSELDAVKTLVETVVTLAVFEVQQIVAAIVNALSGAVNTLLGVKLL